MSFSNILDFIAVETLILYMTILILLEEIYLLKVNVLFLLVNMFVFKNKLVSHKISKRE